MIIYFVVCDYIGSILGLLSNALLIVATHRRRIPGMKHFGHMVLFCAVYDFLYCCVLLLIHHQMQIVNGKLILTSFGIEPLVPQPYANLLNSLEYFFMVYASAIVPVQFYYRHYLMTTTDETSAAKIMKLFKTALIAAIPVFCVQVLVIFVHLKSARRPMTYYTRMLDPHMFPNGVSYVTADDLDDLETVAMFTFGFLFIPFCYLLALYYGYKSLKGVTGKDMSNRTLRLRNQFARNMVAQALNGFLLSVAPLLVICCFMVSGLNVAIPSALIMVCAAWTPFANAVTAFALIRPYRSYILRSNRTSSAQTASAPCPSSAVFSDAIGQSN